MKTDSKTSPSAKFRPGLARNAGGKPYFTPKMDLQNFRFAASCLQRPM
jgi:hypothetical protein